MRGLGYLVCAVVVIGCGRRDFNDGLDAPAIDAELAACTVPPAGCALLYPDGSWADDSCGSNQEFVCSR